MVTIRAYLETLQSKTILEVANHNFNWRECLNFLTGTDRICEFSVTNNAVLGDGLIRFSTSYCLQLVEYTGEMSFSSFNACEVNN